MILPIKKVPEKILRQQATAVSFPISAEHKKLIRDMFETVRAANGVGLAAPQVGKSLRIIVVNLEHLNLPIFALINPEIVWSSKKKTGMEEGCLSIPGIFGIVERPQKIQFRALDLQGNTVAADCDGLLAKVIQHEIDHIDGILITDKMKKITQGADSLI